MYSVNEHLDSNPHFALFFNFSFFLLSLYIIHINIFSVKDFSATTST